MSSGNNTNQAITFPTLNEIGSKWTEITIQRHKEKIKALKIYSTGNLESSLNSSYQLSGDKGLKATITYALYGKYVDMGVGKGVAVGAKKSAAFAGNRKANGQLLRYKRKPRPWYSKVIARETLILGSIMQNYYASRAIAPIVNIPKRIEI